MRPIVSIVLPTYNHAAYLATAIESALAQEMGDLELIISDNASTDETPEIIARYKDPRIKTVRQKTNLGLTGNYNACYQMVHPESQYVTLLPSDDWFEPAVMKTLVELGNKNPEAVLIHCDGFKVGETGQSLFGYMSLFEYHPPVGMHWAIKELFKNNYITAQGALMRRENLERYFPYTFWFNPEFTYTTDYLTWLEIMLRGGKGYYHPEKLIAFRYHEGSHTIDKNLVPRLKEEVRIFKHIVPMCPAELEGERRVALCDRLARLAFLLIEIGQVGEAKPYLQEALQIETRNDLRVANMISALPGPASLKTKMWQVVESVAATLRGKA